jgi:WD40 repeat protein
MSIGKPYSLFVVVVVCPFAYAYEAGSVELLVDSNQRVSKIHSVEFTGYSTLRVVATSGHQTIVSEIGGQDESIDFTARRLPHDAVRMAGEMLIGLSPLQAEIFDLKQQRLVKTIGVQGVGAWPLVCHKSGVCAWRNGDRIHVAPLLDKSEARDYPLHGSAVLSLDISPDGQLLAAAINEARVRVWSLANGTELPALTMEATPDESILGAPIPRADLMPGLFTFPRPGMATAVRFSPDGSILAAANEIAVHTWKVKTWQRMALLRGYRGRVSAIAFSGDSRNLAVAAEDMAVRLFALGSSASSTEICRLGAIAHFLSLREDSRFIVVGLADGSIELWNVAERALGSLRTAGSQRGRQAYSTLANEVGSTPCGDLVG